MILFLNLLDTQEEKNLFTELYNRYQHFCWYAANSVLNDEALAEDAVQDTFLALTSHLDKIDYVESPRTKKFLMTIAKSKAIDILRKKKDSVIVDSEDTFGEIPDEKTDILGDVISRETYHHLMNCIKALDESYRVVFEYRYVHDLSERDTADLLGVSEKTVNVRYFRARKKLREMLEKEGCGDVR